MKTKITKALLVLALVALAPSAFAQMTLNAEGASTTIGGGIFQVSTGVILTATANATNYTAISGHVSGDKEFATNDANPKIGAKAKSVGTDPTAASAVDQDISSFDK